VKRTKSKQHGTVVSWLVRRRWRALLCVLALLCLSMPSLAFGKSLNGTFLGKGTGRDVAFNHHGKPLSDWAGTLKFKLDSGEQLLVFCIQIDVRVSTGNRYRSDGPVLALPNGCKIRYLLDAYPAASAKDADEAAARQLAIWVFSDNVDPMTIEDTNVRDRTIALVTDATGKPCPKRRTEAPDLTIEPASASAAAGQVVAYTVRASPDDAGHAMTVSVGGPAVFADATGANAGLQQQQVTLDGQSAATFWVLITGAGQIDVAVALPYRLEAGTVYSQIDDSHPTQRLVMAESLDLVANASAQISGAAGAPPALTEQATVAAMTPAPPALTEQATVAAMTPAPPALTEQATVVAMTPAPPAATAPQATRRPNRDKTPVPTEQPTETMVAVEAVGITPVLAAEATALPAPTIAPAGAAAVAAPAMRPSQLPNTGGHANPTWLALAIAGLLLSVGWVVRWMRISSDAGEAHRASDKH
jgi:LPXTG-motif cell wall-anchored protein